MKHLYSILLFLSLLSSQLGLAQDKNVFYQYSTINALLEGYFEGNLTCGELKKHGNFGLGTFNQLNGELILLNNICYRSLTDGSIELVNDSVKTPFASVSFFTPSNTFPTLKQCDYSTLCHYMDSVVARNNTVLSVRVDGVFDWIKLRSVPPQTKPYQKLSKIVETQPTFEYQSIAGSLIGFRCPEYAKGFNVPKYHFHFLSKDKKRGGHVLNLRVDDANVSIQIHRSIMVQLPDNNTFDELQLEHDKSKELEKVEK
jgi:acetolactate decarboxylase